MLVTLIGVVLFVPETKGRSLEEIRQLFRPRTVMVDEDPIIDNDNVEDHLDDTQDNIDA